MIAQDARNSLSGLVFILPEVWDAIYVGDGQEIEAES